MLPDDAGRRVRYWMGRRLRRLAKAIEPRLDPNWPEEVALWYSSSSTTTTSGADFHVDSTDV